MKNKALATIIAILIAIGLFYFGYSFNPNLKNLTYSSGDNVTAERRASLLIDDGEKITGFSYAVIEPGDTVFIFLQKVTTDNNITLDYVPAAETSFNAVFVKQIGDKKNGQNNSYWQYWVNGSQPQMGADKYLLHGRGNETVLWTFRPSAM